MASFTEMIATILNIQQCSSDGIRARVTGQTGYWKSSSVMTSSNGNIFRVIGRLCGAVMFSLIYDWINRWVNNREAGDLRRECHESSKRSSCDLHRFALNGKCPIRGIVNIDNRHFKYFSLHKSNVGDKWMGLSLLIIHFVDSINHLPSL